ncbi:MAG: type II toxin-antitoxin system VapC family toxin [Moorellaceae bacterium]
MVARGRSRVFIDSGGFIALIYSDDEEHIRAVRYYNSIKASSTFYTTNMVISETYTWLRYHTSHPVAVKFLDTIERASKNNELVIVQVDISIEEKARQILRKYGDQDFSYVDAVSFVTLELLRINDVFGFDTHYLIFGKNLHP